MQSTATAASRQAARPAHGSRWPEKPPYGTCPSISTNSAEQPPSPAQLSTAHSLRNLQLPNQTTFLLSFSSAHLFGEVALTTDVVDYVELGFEPVDGVFFALEDVFEDFGGAVVALAAA
jgi:hypothetical protein